MTLDADVLSREIRLENNLQSGAYMQSVKKAGLQTVLLGLVLFFGLDGSSRADSLLAVSATQEGTVSFYQVRGPRVSLLKAIPVGKGPTEMCLSPDHNRLYVSVAPEKKIVAIDVKSREVTATLSDPTMKTPDGCTVSPDSKKLYAVDLGANVVLVFSAESNQLLGRIAVGEEPRRALFSPDAKKLIVSNAHSNTLSVIDPATNKVVHTVKTGTEPRTLAYSPDGKVLAVSIIDDDSVAFFKADTLEFEQQVAGQISPQRLAFEPGGRLLFVLGRFEQLGVLDLRADVAYPGYRRLGTTIPVPRLSWGMAMSDDGDYLYVTQGGADYNISVIDVRLMKNLLNLPGPKGVRDIIYIK